LLIEEKKNSIWPLEIELPQSWLLAKDVLYIEYFEEIEKVFHTI